MTELEFENKLIEQLSTGIVINAAKSNQIGDTIAVSYTHLTLPTIA